MYQSTLCSRDTVRIPRRGIISTPEASLKYHSPQSEKGSVPVNPYNPNTLGVKSGLGSLVRACLSVSSTKVTGAELSVRPSAHPAESWCCSQSLEEAEQVRLNISSADGVGTEWQDRGLLDFFSCFYGYLDAPIPAYLPAMKELSKESEVPLSRNKKQQNLFIGDLIEDG